MPSACVTRDAIRFADVASYRLKQGPIRTLSACGSLVVVALYLIAQRWSARGKLIELLFGLNYHVAVVLVGVLMVMYVLFGGMLATTGYRIIKARHCCCSAPALWPLW